MKLRLLGRSGLWVTTRRWNISYWTPWTYQPLSLRYDGDPDGRRGWWGALRVTRYPEVSR